MASHGSSLVGAKMMAREMNVQVLVFGHIHRPIVERGERLLICPGSSTLPRMSAPSVAELEIEGASISGSIIPLGSPVCNYLKFAQSLAKKFEEKN
jgi:putative phosphoesterase